MNRIVLVTSSYEIINPNFTYQLNPCTDNSICQKYLNQIILIKSLKIVTVIAIVIVKLFVIVIVIIIPVVITALGKTLKLLIGNWDRYKGMCSWFTRVQCRVLQGCFREILNLRKYELFLLKTPVCYARYNNNNDNNSNNNNGSGGNNIGIV